MAKNKNKPEPDNEGDILTLNGLMPRLVSQTVLLIDTITKQDPFFIGYAVERISKEKEKDCIVDGVRHLSVTALNQWTQLQGVLSSWKDYYAPMTGSTVFVHRLPGFVVVNDEKDEVLALVHSINEIKDKIAETVRTNRDNHQRHEFIHTVFSGVMTEQLYRKIQVKESHVTNVWFNWVSRPVPKTFSLKEAEDFIEKKKSTPPIDFSPDDWVHQLNKTIENVKSGRFQTIQKLKQFRHLPTIEFNLLKDGGKVRNKHNATTPFILLGQDKGAAPTFTTLEDYNGENSTKRVVVKSTNKEMIDEFLGLAGVR